MEKNMMTKIENIHDMKKENSCGVERHKKKKSGFTLIEVIAVIAIIGIMASVLLPKFTNYINEAKKLKVVEQSRKVVMAVESYNMKASTQLAKTNTVTNVKSTPGAAKYFENIDEETNKLVGGMTLQQCYDVVNGAEITINSGTGVITKVGTSELSTVEATKETEP